jgi:hypothetical protein
MAVTYEIKVDVVSTDTVTAAELTGFADTSWTETPKATGSAKVHPGDAATGTAGTNLAVARALHALAEEYAYLAAAEVGKVTVGGETYEVERVEQGSGYSYTVQTVDPTLKAYSKYDADLSLTTIAKDLAEAFTGWGGNRV